MLAASFHEPGAIADFVITAIAVLVSIFSFIAASRAESKRSKADIAHVDADAYNRAQSLYESVINELRQEVDRLKAEIAQLRKGNG